jgi:superkiller protein 3
MRRLSWRAVHASCLKQGNIGITKGLMNGFLANWRRHRSQLALEKAPENPKVWSKLYGLYLEQDKASEFIGFCRETLMRQPDNQQAWTFLRMAGASQVTDVEAVAFVRDVVRLHPDCERAWAQLDLASEKLENPAEWVAFCREIVGAHTNNMHAWSRLMRQLKSEAKHADLVSACLQALRLKPDAQTWLNLADAYAAQCKFDEAISAYEKALELKPNFLVALNGLGCVLHTVGRFEEAVGIYLKATNLNKGDATPWVWLALAYIQLGQNQRAQEAIAKVRKPLPMVAEMLNNELDSLPSDRVSSEVTNARITVDRLAFQFQQAAAAGA